MERERIVRCKNIKTIKMERHTGCHSAVSFVNRVIWATKERPVSKSNGGTSQRT